MKIKITGKIASIDHARQSIVIKPDNAQPLRVYMVEKDFNKIAGKYEVNQILSKNETAGTFIISGRVLINYKREKWDIKEFVSRLEHAVIPKEHQE